MGDSQLHLNEPADRSRSDHRGDDDGVSIDVLRDTPFVHLEFRWFLFVGATGLLSPPILAFVAYGLVPLTAVIGALIGFAEWLAIRRFRINAPTWIGSSSLGWFLASVATMFVALGLTSLNRSEYLVVPVVGLAGGLGGAMLAAGQTVALRCVSIPHAWIAASGAGLAVAAMTYVALANIGCSPGYVGCQWWLVGAITPPIYGLVSSVGVRSLLRARAARHR
jgi:hypothetical protein